jgi:hypothetical protein
MGLQIIGDESMDTRKMMMGMEVKVSAPLPARLISLGMRGRDLPRQLRASCCQGLAANRSLTWGLGLGLCRIKPKRIH